MAIRWSDEDINNLIEWYPEFGGVYCAEKLGRKISTVRLKASRLGLRVKNCDRTKVSQLNTERFSKLRQDIFNSRTDFLKKDKITPEQAYSLGFLWGDGHLATQGKMLYITLEIATEDFTEIFPILKSLETGKKYWKTYNRKRAETWKETTQAGLYDPYLGKFLEFYDYKNKSGCGADKIVSYIPEKLRHYFFRGLFDADGTFHFNETASSHRASISSVYDQDWNFVLNFYKSIGVDHVATICRNITTNDYKYSNIFIHRQKYLNVLYENIFASYTQDKIGLGRKHETIKEIYDNPKHIKLLKDR